MDKCVVLHLNGTTISRKMPEETAKKVVELFEHYIVNKNYDKEWIEFNCMGGVIFKVDKLSGVEVYNYADRKMSEFEKVQARLLEESLECLRKANKELREGDDWKWGGEDGSGVDES
jgi:hypothetical protein